MFAEVARTVLDIRPAAKDITELVKVAKEAHSDADALQKVADLRAALLPAGPPPHRTTLSPALAAWRRTVPQLLNHADNPMEFLESDPDRRATAIETTRRLHDLFGKVLALYGA